MIIIFLLFPLFKHFYLSLSLSLSLSLCIWINFHLRCSITMESHYLKFEPGKVYVSIQFQCKEKVE